MVVPATRSQITALYPVNEWGRARGYIKFFNRARDVGFIVPDVRDCDHSVPLPVDVFFHLEEFKPGLRQYLQPRQLVEFRLQFTPVGGVRALDCVLLTHSLDATKPETKSFQ